MEHRPDTLTEATSYKPPKAVQDAAKKGLDLRAKFGRGGTSVGVARARDLSNGRSISKDTIGRMVSYFARHAVDKDAKGSKSRGFWKNEKNPSAGWIAWLLWGGDPGKRWADRIWQQLKDEEAMDAKIRKVTKDQANFRKATIFSLERCGSCHHFQNYKFDRCDLVSGKVDMNYTCDLYHSRGQAPKESKSVPKNKTYLSEVVSPVEGVDYTYLDYTSLTEEARANLSEADKMDGKREGVLGKVKMGVMSRADISTRNGTVYPLEILAAQVEQHNAEKVAKKASYMAADHPGYSEDYRVGFANSSAILSELSIDRKTGIVSGAALIIDKEKGRDVAATLRAGGFVGVSSRGYGRTKEGDHEGMFGTVSGRIIQDDFSLEGYDFVLDPSVHDAAVDAMTEEKNPQHDGAKSMNKKQLREEHPEVYSAIQEEGRATALEELTGEEGGFVSRELYETAKATVEEHKAKIAELETTVSEANTKVEESAKALEEATALAEEKAKELESLNTQLEESKAAAEKSAAEALVSEALASHPHREAIRDRMNDTDLATVESAKAAIEREMQYLDRLNIPSPPISLEDFNRKGAAPTEDPSEGTEDQEELSESMRRLYKQAGIPIED